MVLLRAVHGDMSSGLPAGCQSTNSSYSEAVVVLAEIDVDILRYVAPANDPVALLSILRRGLRTAQQ